MRKHRNEDKNRKKKEKEEKEGRNDEGRKKEIEYSKRIKMERGKIWNTHWRGKMKTAKNKKKEQAKRYEGAIWIKTSSKDRFDERWEER